eukprot:8913148-Pyramimonas_sp.AAC.1
MAAPARRDANVGAPLARIATASFPCSPPSLPLRSKVQGCKRSAARSPLDARRSPRRGPGDASGSSAARSEESKLAG